MKVETKPIIDSCIGVIKYSDSANGLFLQLEGDTLNQSGWVLPLYFQSSCKQFPNNKEKLLAWKTADKCDTVGEYLRVYADESRQSRQVQRRYFDAPGKALAGQSSVSTSNL